MLNLGAHESLVQLYPAHHPFFCDKELVRAMYKTTFDHGEPESPVARSSDSGAKVHKVNKRHVEKEKLMREHDLSR